MARSGAWAVWAGSAISTLGISWDVQWHKMVGPDTFFTLPHLALYSGSAIAGIASLVMVLTATVAHRTGRPVARTIGGTPVRLFGGAVTAPLGYLISGLGAASFLLYGLLDLWWHSIYGFDAVLNTPSHVALFLSISITMIGGLIVFAAARDQLWAQAGIAVTIPILITFMPITTNAFSTLSLPLDPVIVGIIFFSSMLLIVGAGLLRRPGGAIAVAAALGILQAFLWWFSPWAAVTYAASIGLPLRDGLVPAPPEVPGAVPMFLVIAALAVEALFWRARMRQLDAWRVVLVAGTLTALVVAATLPLQMTLTDPTAGIGLTDVALIVALGTPFGLLAGFLGARLITMLRATAQTTKES
ncbi:MAG TPA: hypothetical protein VGL20_21385 [Candidatus Dormibacteraeota bacterium]